MDAAKTAERLNEAELAIICGSLAKQVEAVAGRYQSPTQKDLALIRKMTRAVLTAINPRADAGQVRTEARIAAENFSERQRDSFPKAVEIKRNPEDPPVAMVEEPAIEVLTLSRGQVLFKQGDPANAAYIVASGSIAVFREIAGHRVPVARIRKGEFFGEMAIIDGTPRRATAVALEDTTLSLIGRESLTAKMAATPPDIRFLARSLIESLRAVPEKFVPKPRNAADATHSLRRQVDDLCALTKTDQLSETLRQLVASQADKLALVVEELTALIEEFGAHDRRVAALPSTAEITTAVEAENSEPQP